MSFISTVNSGYKNTTYARKNYDYTQLILIREVFIMVLLRSGFWDCMTIPDFMTKPTILKSIVRIRLPSPLSARTV